MSDFPRSPEQLVRRVRRAMDALALELQRRPRLAAALLRVRRVMIWSVKRFLPAALERRELAQARSVMADAPPQPCDGTKVLFMTFRAWTSHVAWETTIAQALRLRGARCEFFYCGSGLPICEMGWPSREQNKPCEFCASYVDAMVAAAHFPKLMLSDLVPANERRALLETVRSSCPPGGPANLDGYPLGPAIEQSLVWHFRSGFLPDTAEVREARRDYLAGAAVMAAAAPRLLDRVEPDVVVLVNGFFYEERIVREEAQARGVRVVTYEVGAQRGTLFFSEGPPAADYDISDLWEHEKGSPLTQIQEAELDQALAARGGGTALSRQYYRRTLSISSPESGRRLLAMFTNVSWDTAVTGKAFAFPTMYGWILDAIRLAGKDPTVELVIRVHPAESRWPKLESRERTADVIARAIPVLPPNVRVVPPEEALDTYALMEAADAVLVFASTVGLEAAARGKGVCVAGKTHYRGRGFTVDVTTPQEFAELLANLHWAEPNAERTELARRYAFLFFCRAMVPFHAVIEEEPSEPIFTFDSISDLSQRHDQDLDLLVDGILGNGTFNLLRQAPETTQRPIDEVEGKDDKSALR